MPSHIVSADMVTQGKPHPEPYRKGAALLGLSPAECLVIEDSASGAKAGHAAGCKVLATLYSHSLEACGDADWIVHSLERCSGAGRPAMRSRCDSRPVDRKTAVAAG